MYTLYLHLYPPILVGLHFFRLKFWWYKIFLSYYGFIKINKKSCFPFTTCSASKFRLQIYISVSKLSYNFFKPESHNFLSTYITKISIKIRQNNFRIKLKFCLPVPNTRHRMSGCSTISCSIASSISDVGTVLYGYWFVFLLVSYA